ASQRWRQPGCSSPTARSEARPIRRPSSRGLAAQASVSTSPATGAGRRASCPGCPARSRARLVRSCARPSPAGAADRARLRAAARGGGSGGGLGRARGCGGDRGAAARRPGEGAVDMITLVWVILGVACGAAIVGVIDRGRRRRLAQLEAQSQETAARIVEEARKEAEVVRKEAQLQAKDLVIQARSEWEREAREQRREIVNLEK